MEKKRREEELTNSLTEKVIDSLEVEKGISMIMEPVIALCPRRNMEGEERGERSTYRNLESKLQALKFSHYLESK